METQQETTAILFKDDEMGRRYMEQLFGGLVLWDWKQILVFLVLCIIIIFIYSGITFIGWLGLPIFVEIYPMTVESVLIVAGLLGLITFKTAVIILSSILIVGLLLLIYEKVF